MDLIFSNMNMSDLEEIKDIFNRGITIWHVDNGANVGDYSVSQLKGNVEV